MLVGWFGAMSHCRKKYDQPIPVTLANLSSVTVAKKLFLPVILSKKDRRGRAVNAAVLVTYYMYHISGTFVL